MPATGIGRLGTTPPPRTAETEHFWDRGIPKPQSKAENKRRKYTVYGRPVKPSKDNPPEFWGERLPYFQNHEFRKVDAVLNPKPKKKRKPKAGRAEVEEVALAMDGTDITREIEQGKGKRRKVALEPPAPREERTVAPHGKSAKRALSSARPGERTNAPSGPVPGFLRGQGKKRKREVGEGNVNDSALSHEQPARREQGMSAGSGANAEEKSSVQLSLDGQLSTEPSHPVQSESAVEGTEHVDDFTAPDLLVDDAAVDSGGSGIED